MSALHVLGAVFVIVVTGCVLVIAWIVRKVIRSGKPGPMFPDELRKKGWL